MCATPEAKQSEPHTEYRSCGTQKKQRRGYSITREELTGRAMPPVIMKLAMSHVACSMPSNRMMHHHQHKTAQHFMSQLLGLERMIKPRLNITLSSCIVLLILLLINNVHSLSTGAIPKAQVDMSQTLDNRTLGFIGCGTIACAIATGLLTQSKHPIEKIYVSRRSESKSRELADKFPDKVVICDDNQAIVDKCDDLFLCVLPQQEEEVLNSLRIGKEKTLVSLVVSFMWNSALRDFNSFC